MFGLEKEGRRISLGLGLGLDFFFSNKSSPFSGPEMNCEGSSMLSEQDRY